MPYPRTPTALKILAGNPGGRPLPVNEPKPEPTIPPCPAHLGKDARKEWKRITPELEKLGILTQIDMAGLAAYCVCYGRWVEAERMLKRHGLTVTAQSGYEAKSPWLTIADKCLDQMRRYATEFGFTPASRSKVSAVPSPDDADDAEFFG